MLIRCNRCLMPTSRPDTQFVDGVCTACLNYAKRETIDWDARHAELMEVINRAKKNRNATGYDCIIPSSGGKDSHYQVLKLIELGLRPLVVTATTCMLTPIGRKNIDNLARYATTIEVSPNKTVRAKLNRIGLEMVGDISWPEHVSIFSVPFKIAAMTGIKTLFYGENPQSEYGGPIGAENAKHLTRRWRSEFGGFLGLRPQDIVGQYGIIEEDMRDYQMPTETEVEAAGIEAHFLGYYLPWDSHLNAQIARHAGMLDGLPSQANWWGHENLDNAMTGIHDYFCYLKYGYGRAAAQLSVDIRNGLISRDKAFGELSRREGRFPSVYAGVPYGAVLKHVGFSDVRLDEIMDQFTNKELFADFNGIMPVLKEFA